MERRSTVFGLGALLVAFAIAAVISELQVAAAYHSYVAADCAHRWDQVACTTDFASRENLASAIRIAASCFPIVAAMFLGAPLFAREYESGTFRYTWTQAVGRRRFAMHAIWLVAGVAALGGIAIGLLVDWEDHAFRTVLAASQWQSGNFDNAPFLLGAWSAFGTVLGTAFGALIGRVFASIAATMCVLGGITLGATVVFVHWLLAIGPKVATHLPPLGGSPGALNYASLQGQPLPGAWFVRSWYTGSNGNVLTNKQFERVQAQMYNVNPNDIGSAARTGDSSSYAA